MGVEHETAGRRFVLKCDEEQAVLDYRIIAEGKVIHFLRTWVPPRFRGRGYGARLVKAGLEYARSEEFLVTSSCWFVDEFLERRPEYQDLVAE